MATLERTHNWARAIVLIACGALLVLLAYSSSCASLTGPQAVQQIELTRADLRDVSALLDPVEDAGSIKTLADIDRGLGALEEALAAQQPKNALDAMDLLTAQAQALYIAYGDPQNEKHQRIRLALTVVKGVLRRVRASVEA